MLKNTDMLVTKKFVLITCWQSHFFLQIELKVK